MKQLHLLADLLNCSHRSFNPIKTFHFILNVKEIFSFKSKHLCENNRQRLDPKSPDWNRPSPTDSDWNRPVQTGTDRSITYVPVCVLLEKKKNDAATSTAFSVQSELSVCDDIITLRCRSDTPLLLSSSIRAGRMLLLWRSYLRA